MSSTYRKVIRDLALQRVRILYGLAIEMTRRGNYEKARRYVGIALRILEKANIRKPIFLRRGICKNCYIPLIPGLTASVRIRGNRKYVIVTKKCLLCGWVSRLPCPKRKK